MATRTECKRITIWFAAYATACVGAFWAPLHRLMQVALASETYSHILIVPFVSIGTLWMERERVFPALERSRSSAAVLLFGVGALLGAFGWRNSSSSTGGDWLALAIL